MNLGHAGGNLVGEPPDVNLSLSLGMNCLSVSFAATQDMVLKPRSRSSLLREWRPWLSRAAFAGDDIAATLMSMLELLLHNDDEQKWEPACSFFEHEEVFQKDGSAKVSFDKFF